MKLYLLTAITDHEGEDPVFLAASLEEAKAAAVVPAPGSRAPDWYCIYEAEPGTQPVPMLEVTVRHGWDRDACRSTYTLTDWSPA